MKKFGGFVPTREKTDSNNLLQNFENSKYLVGLHTVGINSKQIQNIDTLLRYVGFLIDNGYNFGYNDKPSWMANESTVFYYSSTSIPKAHEIAKLMQEATGKKFIVKKGS